MLVSDTRADDKSGLWPVADDPLVLAGLVEELVDISRGRLSVLLGLEQLCDNGDLEWLSFSVGTVSGAADLIWASDNVVVVGNFWLGNDFMGRRAGDLDRLSFAGAGERTGLSDRIGLEVTWLADGVSLIRLLTVSTTSTETSGIGPNDSSLSRLLPWFLSPKGFRV